MRIVYMIGNGFDLHIGLHTSYPGFLKYYLEQPLPADMDDLAKRFIKRLKENIRKDQQLWSDFELEYGHYMAKIGEIGSAKYSLDDELEIINDDIRINLSRYIANEENLISFTEEAKKRFLDDLTIPEIHLRDYETNDIKYKKSNSWHRTSNEVDFITFNYTKTIEQLLNNKKQQMNGFSVNLPVHVHGFHNNRMIMGVNDVSQIDNEELRKSTYALDTLVKSRCNHAYGIGHTDRTSSLISSAQLLCIYGMSFGDTDKMWWNRICQELIQRGELTVVIFWYDKDIPNYSNEGPKLQRKINQVVDKLLLQGGIKLGDIEGYRNRVYVAINKPIFNIQIDDRTPVEKMIGKSAPGTIERFTENGETIRSTNKTK